MVRLYRAWLCQKQEYCVGVGEMWMESKLNSLVSIYRCQAKTDFGVFGKHNACELVVTVSI